MKYAIYYMVQDKAVDARKYNEWTADFWRGEGEGGGGALFFYSYHIYSVYLFPLFYPYFITYFLSKNLFRGVTKMLSKPFTGSW